MTDLLVADAVLAVGAVLEDRLRKRPKRGPVVGSASILR